MLNLVTDPDEHPPETEGQAERDMASGRTQQRCKPCEQIIDIAQRSKGWTPGRRSTSGRATSWRQARCGCFARVTGRPGGQRGRRDIGVNREDRSASY